MEAKGASCGSHRVSGGLKLGASWGGISLNRKRGFEGVWSSKPSEFLRRKCPLCSGGCQGGSVGVCSLHVRAQKI